MKNYIEDLLVLLSIEADELKKVADSEFEKGKLFGYYEIISMILNQADAFGISLSKKWIDYNPDDLFDFEN